MLERDDLPMGLGLTNEHISRQLDLVPPEILNTYITIIGAGAIGSWTALGLAKSGFKNITVFDYDKVDIVNMSSQFYGLKDIGRNKVDALADRIREMTGELMVAINLKFTNQKVRGILILAVDSMAARKEIFEAQKLNMRCPWVIDSRMGAEMALLYTANPSSSEDVTFYEATLYTDEQATQERCTAKSTGYCALVLSGLVVKTVKDLLTRGKYIRNLAFSLKESDFLAFCVEQRPKAE